MYCIFYCNKKDITKWKVMKHKRSDGVLVPAKTKKEVQMFKFQHAVAFAKTILDEGVYDADVKLLADLYLPKE